MGVLPFLRGYRPARLRADALAGLTVWAVLVPEAFAYATIAGVSPVVGLYAAPAALVAYALLGSSKQLVVGPMSATAALSATALAGLGVAAAAYAPLTAALALVVGVIALAAGLARLGFISNFVSEPVLKGFIVGMAATIVIGQVPKLLGVDGGSGSFVERVVDLVPELGGTDGLTLAVGLAGLATVLALRRFAPRAPGSLLVVAGAVAVSALLDLEGRGVDVVGSIGSGLPSVGLPDVSWADCVSLAGPAVGIVFVGFAEGLGAARTYAQQTHDEIDANRELIGLGGANVAAGLGQGMVVNGSLSKTAVNGAAGARSQVSGLVTAALTVATLFVTTLFEPLPEAILAAVVIAAVVDLIDLGAIRRFARARSATAARVQGAAARADLLGAMAALLGVLVLDTLPGLLLGVGVSLLLLIVRSSRPYVAELGRVDGTDRYADLAREPRSAPVPGLVIVRPEGPLFFANAQAIRRHVLALVGDQHPAAVVIDAETVPSVDLTSAVMLRDLADELGRTGVRLALARDIGQVRDLLDADAAGPLESYPTVRQAVAGMRS